MVRLGTFTSMGPGSIPGWGTKIPQAAAKNKTKQKLILVLVLFIHSFNKYLLSIYCVQGTVQDPGDILPTELTRLVPSLMKFIALWGK